MGITSQAGVTRATKQMGFFIKMLPRLVDFRNWLLTSGEVGIVRILTKGLPVGIA
jgi:hypothetical protein